MVKILDFNGVRNFWQKVIVYMFPLIYIFSRNVFSINHYVLVIQFYISADGYTTTTSENKNLLRT